MRRNNSLYIVLKITEYITVVLVACALAIGVFLMSNSVRAEGIDLMTSLEVNGGYNDNILFNSIEPVDDFFTSIVSKSMLVKDSSDSP